MRAPLCETEAWDAAVVDAPFVRADLLPMISQLLRDAREIARAERRDDRAPAPLSAALASDGFRVLALQRLREAAIRLRVPVVPAVLRSVQTALLGVEISRDARIGEGVYFVHSLGTIIGGDSRIGARVRLYGNNTVGTVNDDGYPTIEDDVRIGAGARILGPIRVGAGARIGANAVVLTDVPAGHVAVGIPARILPPKPLRSASQEPDRLEPPRGGTGARA